MVRIENLALRFVSEMPKNFLMNISAWIGFAIAFAVLYMGVLHGATNPYLFLDPHALILVCGGTIAAGLIAFPLKRFAEIRDLILLGVLFKRKQPGIDVAKQLVEASQLYRERGFEGLKLLGEPHHPFLAEALYFVGKDYIDAFELRNVLEKRSTYFKKRYQQDYKTLNALGKFPPAFGLLGATTGMIAMMTQLSGKPDQIGPAMATALVATFWGIAVANFLVLPLADYANRVVQEDQGLRNLIIEGVLAIKEGQPTIIVFERLAASLPPQSRLLLKESLNGARDRVDDPSSQAHLEEFPAPNSSEKAG